MLYLAAATAEGDRGIGWVYLVAVIVGFYVLRRLWWRLVGRDRRRNLDARQKAEMYRRWGARCAYRYAMLPGRGPFLCRGPLVGAHQIAHSRGGRSRPGNVMPLCDRHNDRMKARSNLSWTAVRSIPVLGWVLLFRRWVWAEWVRKFLR